MEINQSKLALATESLAKGAGWIRERFGLVVLLYAVNLLVALLLAIPVYLAFVDHVGSTGFGTDMMQAFDLMLWRDALDLTSDALLAVLFQLLWVLPLYWVWKTASHVGVAYALHQGGIWPFWRGVGYYTGRGLLISLAFLPLKGLILAIAFIIGGFWVNLFQGEIGTLWGAAVIGPFIGIAGLAVMDLFQRYAWIAIVVRHDTVGRALSAGFSWPFKYSAASYLYLIWFGIVLIIFGIAVALNAYLHVGTAAALLGFAIQQVSLFTRAAATVGWIGSEVYLFETTHIRELPLIADAGKSNAMS